MEVVEIHIVSAFKRVVPMKLWHGTLLAYNPYTWIVETIAFQEQSVGGLRAFTPSPLPHSQIQPSELALIVNDQVLPLPS